MSEIMTINGVDCYERDGTAYLRLETVLHGLGFTQEYTEQRLKELGFPHKWGEDTFIPENIFCHLSTGAESASAQAFYAEVIDEVLPAIHKHGACSARPLPRPFESVQAARLLLQARGPDRIGVIRLLKQGGFDVDMIDSVPAAQPAVQESPAAGNAANGAADDASGNPGNDITNKDHIREFLEDILPRVQWDMLPFKVLHDVYGCWLGIYHPDVPLCGRKRFIRRLEPLVGDYGWALPEKNDRGHYKKMWTKGRMDGPEPVIAEFKIKYWYDTGHNGSSLDLLASPKPALAYSGIYRVKDRL